ncbi:MAG TPA: type II secretion system minor pseudopilin GspI [Rubrivivax sp.]|nr:type II secretion system minor pseudopilin GspI [Burkholderiales bacterium]HNU09954.1 type II secretion system minor pseudopilin GspI [Rubrivivax sp.]
MRRSRGFTLVEVLVALAVVAVALAAGARAAMALGANAERLRDVTIAQWCADNELVDLRLARVLPGIGDADFRCEQLGLSFEGRLVTRPTPNPNMRRIDATVRDAAGHPLVTLTTVMSRY